MNTTTTHEHERAELGRYCFAVASHATNETTP